MFDRRRLQGWRCHMRAGNTNVDSLWNNQMLIYQHLNFTPSYDDGRPSFLIGFVLERLD